VHFTPNFSLSLLLLNDNIVSNTSALNILVAPLNWGIGHATRCVPIINMLLEKGHNVMVASDGRSADFLKKEYPQLKHLNLNSYNIKYAKSGKFLILKILLQTPSIMYAVIKEHYLLKKIVRQNNINLIISDNRYGLWHKQVYSVFMTHQLMLKMPNGFAFAEKIMHHFIKHFVGKFDECWVPDYESALNLSGDLSHKYKVGNKTFFVGPLSRFSTVAKPSDNLQKDIKLLFILSGPEPQRTVFENLIIEQLRNNSIIAIIVRGITERFEEIKLNENVVMYSHLTTSKMVELIHRSEIIVSRSGYSSVMDWYWLNVNAFLVPTPGQTEQEYLAAYLMQKKMFYSLSQEHFKINAVADILNKTPQLNCFTPDKNECLSKRIDLIIDDVRK